MTDVEPTAEQTGRPRWTRFAALGLVMVAVGPLVMFLGAIVWGLDTGDFAFFGVIGAVGLIGAYLVWRFGTWSKVVGIVLGVLLGGAMFWTAFGLFAPHSFFDFVPGILVIPGAVIAISSCIGALVAAKRGHRSEVPVGGERRGIRTAIGAVIVLAALSGVMTNASRSSVSDPAQAAVRVEMKDFEFTEARYSVPGGSDVLVENDDPFFHTFTVDELGINEGFTLGSDKLVRIPAEPGTYILYCTLHTSNREKPGKDDMAATLVVT